MALASSYSTSDQKCVVLCFRSRKCKVVLDNTPVKYNIKWSIQISIHSIHLYCSRRMESHFVFLQRDKERGIYRQFDVTSASVRWRGTAIYKRGLLSVCRSAGSISPDFLGSVQAETRVRVILYISQMTDITHHTST